MAGTQYRSVKLVLQNSTNEMLTIQGVATLHGDWDMKKTPIQGGMVGEQSAADWLAYSDQVGFGVSGFLRLGSPTGYFSIRFDLPWSGPFSASVDETSPTRTKLTIDDTHPDHVVIVVVIGAPLVETLTASASSSARSSSSTAKTSAKSD